MCLGSYVFGGSRVFMRISSMLNSIADVGKKEGGIKYAVR